MILKELNNKSKDSTYKSNDKILELVRGDKFLSHLLSKKFNLNEEELITNNLSKKMFFKIMVIRSIPLLTIILGSILALKSLWDVLNTKKIPWKEFNPLDLDVS